ncbi:jg27169 [Pararge aegeria aegeria]|uniref:Jg27169 protein n=2 Tax=Pararge aegeria TaxID=116150 RepID=A0A8S4SMI3_9NEOP|nr:jg27169 [Pararge aegeria aegeria]
MYQLNPIRLIEEIKKRPGLYRTEHPADREEKLQLWKEVGAEIYDDWDSFNKATAYDRVLQLQRKWRSLRDAYNRELRARKSTQRGHRRVYIYFKRMSFLGGFEGTVSEEDEDGNDIIFANSPSEDPDPLFPVGPENKPAVKVKRKRRKKSISSYDEAPEEMEMPVFNMDVAEETDSDKLFLMSFLPEMKQLPANVKMWARAQIANVMQEAVTCHFNNSFPSTSNVMDRSNSMAMGRNSPMVKHRRVSSEQFGENI